MIVNNPISKALKYELLLLIERRLAEKIRVQIGKLKGDFIL
jgi:hypothetical protein